MKRIAAVLAILAVMAIAGGADKAAAYTPSAYEVAKLTLAVDPSICEDVLPAVRAYGFWTAEAAFAEGYGAHKHPSAAKVFYAIVRICQRRA